MNFIIDDEVIKGHDKYLLIMKLIKDKNLNLSIDKTFMSTYSGYYFPSQIKETFKELYFKYMQEHKDNIPTFREAIEDIYNLSGEVHYSFTSKMIHTLNPRKPVLDQHILRLLGFQQKQSRQLNKSSKNYSEKKQHDAIERIEYYSNIYKTIEVEYKKYKNAPFMIEAVNKFNLMFPEYKNISYTKKVDLLLFRLKNERGVSTLDYLNIVK